MTKVEDLTNVEVTELDWIQLRKDMGPIGENFADKFMRKVKENPVVPVGKFQPKDCLHSHKTLFFRMSCYNMCLRIWIVQLPHRKQKDVTNNDEDSYRSSGIDSSCLDCRCCDDLLHEVVLLLSLGLLNICKYSLS